MLTLCAVSVCFANVTFDEAGLAEKMSGHGWNKKKNTAVEYKSADSNYRTYKPQVSTTPAGGLLVSTKLDHIRGWGGDDHCLLQLTFDGNGKVVSSQATIEMGDKSFDTKIIMAAASLTGDAPTIATSAVASEIYNRLKDQISKWNEHGGRANFPAVIQHNFNNIATSVSVK